MSDDELRFSDLLDDAATGFERALVDVTAPDLAGIPVEVIDTLWDAATIREDLIPLLAYSMGVNLFEGDYWSVDKQREWVGQNWEFLARRGTLKGVRMALEISGYSVQQTVLPPQAFYASPALSKEEINEWIERMPSIRITYADRQGQDNGQWFANHDHVGGPNSFAGVDAGYALYGRYGILRRNGVDTPLQTITEYTTIEKRKATDFERMVVPGLSTMGFFAGDGAVGGMNFVGAGEIVSTLVSFRVDSSYDSVESRLALNTLVPGLEPIDIRHRITSDEGDAGLGTFSDDAFAGQTFATPSNAERMLADTIYLLDPAVSVPMSYGASFAGVDRVGMPLRTAEMMIDLHTTATPSSAYVSDAFQGDFYALQVDESHIDRAIRGIEASRGHLDRVLVQFDALRPISASDTIAETSLLGDWVKNSL